MSAGGGQRSKKTDLDFGSSSEEEDQLEVEKGKDFSSSLIQDHPDLLETGVRACYIFLT